MWNALELHFNTTKDESKAPVGKVHEISTRASNPDSAVEIWTESRGMEKEIILGERDWKSAMNFGCYIHSGFANCFFAQPGNDPNCCHPKRFVQDLPIFNLHQ